MMSSHRAEYGSYSEWLAALRADEAWRCQLKLLQESAAADANAHREDALRRIGCAETFEFWEIYGHQVERVVEEVWEIADLSLPKLKIQTIGMLSIEWLEQQASDSQNSKKEQPNAAIVELLKPMFYGSEKEAKAFLECIKNMKPKQITDKVNQLVSERIISDVSRHRELWKVLHDGGFYERTESNWNQQVM